MGANMQTGGAGSGPTSTGGVAEFPARLTRLFIRSGERAFFVATEAIRWIQADGDFVRLHTAGESHRVRATLAGLHARLDPRQFLRIHRSAIVNVEWVAELRIAPGGEGRVVLQDGGILRLSRSFRRVLKESGGMFATPQRSIA